MRLAQGFLDLMSLVLRVALLPMDPGTQSGGATLSLGGMEFRVVGTPEAGDSLGIVNNSGGVGDNSNCAGAGWASGTTKSAKWHGESAGTLFVDCVRRWHKNLPEWRRLWKPKDYC